MSRWVCSQVSIPALFCICPSSISHWPLTWVSREWVWHPPWARSPPSCAGMLPLDPEQLVSDPFCLYLPDWCLLPFLGLENRVSWHPNASPSVCFLGLSQEVPPLLDLSEEFWGGSLQNWAVITSIAIEDALSDFCEGSDSLSIQ